MREGEAAVRRKPDEAPPTTAPATLSPTHRAKESVFDPSQLRFSDLLRDPVYSNIRGKWRDRQSVGRLGYEAMYKHPAVAAPFRSLLAFLKAMKPRFRPSVRDPSAKQIEIAEFAQSQLDRLGRNGEANQGWEKFINGFIGQGLEFGFSLAEITTEVDDWRGKAMIQLDGIYPLPQASLDAGFIPREEFGEAILGADPRYRCFELDARGRVEGVIQYYRNGNKEDSIAWRGEDLKNLLHYIHGGGDGNPFGESLLYPAFYYWSELYTRELQEGVFNDMALPLTVVSYDADTTSPALHEEVKSAIDEFDPQRRLLVGRRITVSSVAPTNKEFVDHIKAVKADLKIGITESLMVPHTLYGTTADNESDARNIIQVFFKYTIQGILDEISNVISNQLIKRLLQSNYSNLASEDYPVLDYNVTLDNDLRVAANLLVQLLPYMDTNRLGEAFGQLIPGFDPAWIPREHSDSVAQNRAVQQAPGKPNSQANPPIKQPGTPDTKATGQTESVGIKVNTVAALEDKDE